MKQFLSALCLAFALAARASEVIPPAPKAYFNDYAGVVSAETNARLNKTLEDFERTTSNQILVAIYTKMQSDSSIEDYTVRVARSWKVGQKERNNGAVLFVFTQDRKVFFQVGYGLEGALPDALCKRIIEDEIKPRFKKGDYNDGLSAGVIAILAATKSEYRGTGTTHASPRGSYPSRSPDLGTPPVVIFLIVLIVFIIFFAVIRGASRGRYYSGGGWTSGGWGGGRWSGGRGGSSSSGGGFSGGGGDFGGGGAGGSW